MTTGGTLTFYSYSTRMLWVHSSPEGTFVIQINTNLFWKITFSHLWSICASIETVLYRIGMFPIDRIWLFSQLLWHKSCCFSSMSYLMIKLKVEQTRVLSSLLQMRPKLHPSISLDQDTKTLEPLCLRQSVTPELRVAHFFLVDY